MLSRPGQGALLQRTCNRGSAEGAEVRLTTMVPGTYAALVQYCVGRWVLQRACLPVSFSMPVPGLGTVLALKES